METNEDRADVESIILESEKIKEKLTGEKGKLDFKEQLRDLDVEISGKADMGCNVQKVPKAWILESKKKVSVKRKENRVSDESVLGLGVRLPSSGPQVVLGHTEATARLAETKDSLDQVKEVQLFQVRPKMPGANERGFIKKAKSPNRKNPHAYACKPGKENIGMCTSNLQKVNALEEIT